MEAESSRDLPSASLRPKKASLSVEETSEPRETDDTNTSPGQGLWEETSQLNQWSREKRVS